MKNRQKNNAGFTLIELIIVVSIIVVLSSLAYVSLSQETGQARDSKRIADLKTLESAISMSNAQNRNISYLSPITTGTGASNAITTTAGDVRVLRNAEAFKLASGFISSTILANIERDPFGAAYIGAFINDNQFQLVGTLERPETETPETYIVGSFKAGAIVDNTLTSLDNNDTLISVANAGQFIRGDVIEIDNEQMTVADISTDEGGNDIEAIIVTRGSNSTTATSHSSRAAIKLVTPATNASSLFCLGSLTTLTASAADATGANVPDDLTVTLTDVTLENSYTCTSAGDVSHEGDVIIYDVSI